MYITVRAGWVYIPGRAGWVYITGRAGWVYINRGWVYIKDLHAGRKRVIGCLFVIEINSQLNLKLKFIHKKYFHKSR